MRFSKRLIGLTFFGHMDCKVLKNVVLRSTNLYIEGILEEGEGVIGFAR